jgi:hypothetical protein
MDGENLVFEFRKPFDLFIDLKKCPDWLGLVNDTITFSRTDFDFLVYRRQLT